MSKTVCAFHRQQLNHGVAQTMELQDPRGIYSNLLLSAGSTLHSGEVSLGMVSWKLLESHWVTHQAWRRRKRCCNKNILLFVTFLISLQTFPVLWVGTKHAPWIFNASPFASKFWQKYAFNCSFQTSESAIVTSLVIHLLIQINFWCRCIKIRKQVIRQRAIWSGFFTSN